MQLLTCIVVNYIALTIVLYLEAYPRRGQRYIARSSYDCPKSSKNFKRIPQRGQRHIARSGNVAIALAGAQ